MSQPVVVKSVHLPVALAEEIARTAKVCGISQRQVIIEALEKVLYVGGANTGIDTDSSATHPVPPSAPPTYLHPITGQSMTMPEVIARAEELIAQHDSFDPKTVWDES